MVTLGSEQEIPVSAKSPLNLTGSFQVRVRCPRMTENAWGGDGQLLLKATVSQVANGGWTTC